jgi:pSer/pThr/pTyr-binding forkhead associated (FHA) protein
VFHASFNSQKKQVKYALLITYGNGTSHSFPVGEAAITVGRSPSTAIRVSEEGVSRQHCVISPAGGRLMVLDQGSTNGTYVNGALVRHARLTDGDVVQVGKTKIRVQAIAAEQTESTKVSTPAPPGMAEPEMTLKTKMGGPSAPTVFRLAERLAGSEGAVSAAELVLDAAMDAFPADRAYLLASRTRGKERDVEVLASKARQAGDDTTGRLDQEVPRRILDTLAADPHLTTAADATAAVQAALAGRNSGPVLCSPMRQGGQVVGALVLDAQILPEWVESNEMLSYLSSLGALAALAVSRARLRADLEVERSVSRRQSQRLLLLEEGGTRDGLAMVPATFPDGRPSDPLVRQFLRPDVTVGLAREVSQLVGELTNHLGLVGRNLGGDSHEATTILRATGCARKILNLVEEVRIAAQLEEGDVELDVRATELKTIAESAVRRHELRAAEVGVVLRKGPLPAGLWALVDCRVMGRILDALFDNALAHTGPGGSVIVSTRSAAAVNEVIVADTGPGVSTRERARFFSGNAPASGTKRSGGPSLYFALLAAHRMGGSLNVSGPSGNHRFVVSLPPADPE